MYTFGTRVRPADRVGEIACEVSSCCSCDSSQPRRSSIGSTAAGGDAGTTGAPSEPPQPSSLQGNAAPTALSTTGHRATRAARLVVVAMDQLGGIASILQQRRSRRSRPAGGVPCETIPIVRRSVTAPDPGEPLSPTRSRAPATVRQRSSREAARPRDAWSTPQAATSAAWLLKLESGSAVSDADVTAFLGRARACGARERAFLTHPDGQPGERPRVLAQPQD